MAKRFNFKLRISKIIFSINPCGGSNSKDPSSNNNPLLPSFFRFSTVNPTVLLPNHRSSHTITTSTTTTTTHRSFLKRHVSSAFLSAGCCRSRSNSQPTHSDHDEEEDNIGITTTKKSSREQDNNWHVIENVFENDVVFETPARRKVYTSSVSGRSETENDDVFLPPPPPPPSSAETKFRKKKKKRRSKRKTTSSVARSILFRISTSSAESGIFSNDEIINYNNELNDEEETETLVSSSRSFSTTTDYSSSELFNTQLETIRETTLDHTNYSSNNNKKKKKRKKSSKRCVSKQGMRKSLSSSSESSSSPARLSMFQRMIPCSVDGKVRESFAVVKKSADPYEDFKRSMMEMILEKQMFEDKDLEQLLHCFLSLNSRDHHGIIVRAFSEIWEILFSSTQT
ncbi:hypothetical protein F8388_017659 [Cannabis sativa]|uniref:Transcription repressor n=2 Tax=Cannabis sativa TaxID=3483 RepID=A0A7J6HD36_CANSA|nr:hypothetical protein F8388_017659 [Cannabis sativa]KAF4393256.1 hypothetical protein G4B88_001990 [Cannabis sativa]